MENLQPIFTIKELISMRSSISNIFIHQDIEYYIKNIVISLRNHSMISNNLSPRAVIALKQASKVIAFLSGQTFVTPSHIFKIAFYIINHRIVLKKSSSNNINIRDIINSILETEIPPL
jgi:MoxR-like ATPase